MTNQDLSKKLALDAAIIAAVNPCDITQAVKIARELHGTTVQAMTEQLYKGH